ncbi:hypothetical protein AGDE_03479 [Angomonas deanei]|uniref:Reverse transcriptase (RNA-dependent DNA polymerase), putative n=1 Tax=Angomonas deanei TaxID=59799 RepID=A0A7G2C7Z5_9TRYP|nr:hypothetical protein AGDE_03479 [Angomonas deanei]CAD2215151.1 Reverse transcriptase (RNA-dependent DNA polymerase), putative [Angomonas deanei]|eukprot:EPY40449.1 hypothetical protein AGDE_03479 [Angomonas deanei]
MGRFPLPRTRFPAGEHSILPRRSLARLPRSEIERAAPLHVQRISPLDLGSIRSRMNEGKRKRFDALWQLLHEALRALQAGGTAHQLTPADAHTLRDAHLIEPLTKEQGLVASAFSVVEEKHGKLRRRFILWPKVVNEWLAAQEYKPEYELPTQPWPSVLAECGGVTDLTTSFFQVELPPELRPLFTMVAEDGSRYQMRVLPMGLSISPEIMQMITATLAGHPDYAANPYSSVHVNVWIDNIQVTGPKPKVQTVLRDIKRTASQCGITLNEDETLVSTEYTFAGIRFNHNDKTVALGEKAHRKLCSDYKEHYTLEELERLFGKLWFAARVLDIPVQRCWWFLKSVRRQFSKWSRGLLTGSSTAALSTSARRQMDRWYTWAAENKPRVIRNLPVSNSEFDLFTDSTLDGWGAVCINRATKRTIIMGARWPTRSDNINAAETRAVFCAFQALIPELPRGAQIHLHVDNTSALASLRKGYARSEAINAELHTRLSELPYHIQADYVQSAANPADYPSRNPMYQATRVRYMRHG